MFGELVWTLAAVVIAVITALLISSGFHIGIVQCKDALYSDKELLYKDNILASEMESASIFAVGASKNVRTGSALFVMHNHKISENNNQNCTIEEAIDFTIETIKILINNDKNRSK